MNSNPAQFEEVKILEEKLKSAQIPQELYQKVTLAIERLVRIASGVGYSQEYEMISRYIDWIISLPWNKRSQDTLSLDEAQKILDSNHYGLEHAKNRVLEFISVANLKVSSKSSQGQKAPSLLLQGLVGTGKTTFAYSIAQTLGRQFGRIPMGGMGDALQLRGRAKSYPDSEPGQIMKVLRRVQMKNPVILLDEIDRVTEEARADIMGVLVELLDPEQHSSFLDHYIDFPFDLSEVLFIATANNTSSIATAVLDRLEVIELPSYTDEQKIIIGKNYLLPRIIMASGLSGNDIVFSDDVWMQIVRPLGYDAGMRTLERTISGISRKVARLKVEGKLTKIVIDSSNLKTFLPSW